VKVRRLVILEVHPNGDTEEARDLRHSKTVRRGTYAAITA
jgi:hypothetical protein